MKPSGAGEGWNSELYQRTQSPHTIIGRKESVWLMVGQRATLDLSGAEKGRFVKAVMASVPEFTTDSRTFRFHYSSSTACT